MTTTRKATSRTYFAGRPEMHSSYRNQQLLAARDLGSHTLCLHGTPLHTGCLLCRTSGTVLLPV